MKKFYFAIVMFLVGIQSLTYSSVWVPIQSTSELKTNDVVILAFEDGNGGGNSYLLYAKSGETAGFLQQCTYNNSTKQFSIEPTNFYYHTVTANDDGTYKLKNKESYGLEFRYVETGYVGQYDYKTSVLYNSSSTQELGQYGSYKSAHNITDFQIVQASNNHFYVTRNDYYCVTFQSATSASWVSTKYDQFANSKNLVADNYKGNAATIYKKCEIVTLNAGTGTGDDIVIASSEIDLADYTTSFTPPAGEIIYGWLDSRNSTLHPCDAVLPVTESFTLTAQYSLPRVTFDVSACGGNAAPAMLMGTTITIPTDYQPALGYRFLGWSETPNGTATIFPGDTYPKNGVLTQHTTLYAVGETVGNGYYYTLVTSLADLATIETNHDTIVITLKDGNGGPVEKAMHFNAGKAYLVNWNPMTKSTYTSGSRGQHMTLTKCGTNQYYIGHLFSTGATNYLYANSPTDTRAATNQTSWTFAAVDAPKGLYTLYYSSYYLCDNQSYYNSSTDYRTLYRNATTIAYNQHANNKSLAEVYAMQDKYPYVWTIYKVNTGKAYRFTFDLGDDVQGSVPTQYGPYIQFPTVTNTPAAPGKALDHWEDAIGTTYAPGTTMLRQNGDETFTAVYRDAKVHFVVSNGTCSVSEMTGSPITLPTASTITPNSGYRFGGWSTTANSMDANAGQGGDSFAFTKETTLYAVMISTKVWIPTEENYTSGECILTIQGGAPQVKQECYAMPFMTSSSKAVDMVPYMYGGVICNPPANTILTKGSNYFKYTYGGASYYDYHQNGSVNIYFTQTNSASTNQKVSISFSEATKSYTIYSSYSSSTYYWYLTSGLIFSQAKEVYSSSGPGFTNQISNHYDLATCWADNTTLPNRFTIWKPINVSFINLDANGGICDLSRGFGFIDRLPTATKNGMLFVGWTDDGGNTIYHVGDRYPTTGYLPDTEDDVTLTALYKEGNTSWLPVNDISELQVGDNIVFTIEDAGTQSNKYAYKMEGTTVSLVAVDMSHPDSKCIYTINSKPDATKMSLYAHNGYMLRYEGGLIGSLKGQNGDTTWNFIALNDSPIEHYQTYTTDISSSRFIWKDNSYDKIGTSSCINQYTAHTNLDETFSSQSKHPYAWTVYKQNIQYKSTITFDTNGHGSIEPDSYTGFSLNLPAATPESGYTFLGWALTSDATQPDFVEGYTYYLTADITLYAVYEKTQITLTLDGKGKWLDQSTADIVEETMDVVLPNVEANYGYRFLGWSQTQGASTADYEVGQNFHSDFTTTIYAVYSQVEEVITGFSPITSLDDIHEGDVLLFLMEDGGDGGHQYVLNCTTNSYSLDVYDPYNVTTAQQTEVVTWNSPKGTFKNRSSNGFLYIWFDDSNINYTGVSFGLSVSADLKTMTLTMLDNLGHALMHQVVTHKQKGYYSGAYENHNLYIDCNKGNSLTYQNDNQGTNQFSTHQNLSDLSHAGAWTILRRGGKYAYTVTYQYPDNTSESVSDWTVVLPEGKLISGYEFKGWASTKANADAGNADFGKAGDRIFTEETRDITLYAVYDKLLEYTVLEWQSNAIIIQTQEFVTNCNTQVESGDIIPNDLSVTILDPAIYKLNTTSLIDKCGQTLNLFFSKSETALGRCFETIPYITDNQEETLTEIASTSDIVVLPNTKLTIGGSLTVGDITVMGNGKLVIPEEVTLTADHIYLRAGHPSNSNYSTYEYTYPQLAVEGTLNITSDTIYLDYLLNKKQQYTFAVPVQVKRADIKASTGEDVTFKVAAYDGSIRATGGNGWGYTEATTFEPGVGYTIFATPLTVIGSDGFPTKQTYVTLRIPMVVGDSYAENTPRSVTVRKYPSTQNETLADWNLVSVPYMCNYKGALSIGDVGQTYVTIPDNLGSSYENSETATEELPAFKNFFVQAAVTGDLTFEKANRMASAPWMNAPENDDFRTGIILTNGTVTDKVGLLIGKDYTPAYEVNADLAKWMNAVLSVYAIVDNNELAYAAINDDMATQAIPIGYKTTKSGTYTFSLNRKYDASLVKAVWLMDNELGYVTDLLLEDYVFTTKATTDNKRFAIAVERAEYHAPTGTQTTSDLKDGDCYDIFGRKMQPNHLAPGQIYIMGNEKFIK